MRTMRKRAESSSRREEQQENALRTSRPPGLRHVCGCLLCSTRGMPRLSSPSVSLGGRLYRSARRPVGGTARVETGQRTEGEAAQDCAEVGSATRYTVHVRTGVLRTQGRPPTVRGEQAQQDDGARFQPQLKPPFSSRRFDAGKRGDGEAVSLLGTVPQGPEGQVCTQACSADRRILGRIDARGWLSFLTSVLRPCARSLCSILRVTVCRG